MVLTRKDGPVPGEGHQGGVGHPGEGDQEDRQPLLLHQLVQLNTGLSNTKTTLGNLMRLFTLESWSASGASSVAETRMTGGKARARSWGHIMSQAVESTQGTHGVLQLEERGDGLEAAHVVWVHREHL